MGVGIIIKKVKEIHKQDVVLVQMGKFYYAYGEDAYILSGIFGYKLNEFEKNIYSVAFPGNSYAKVISKLEQLKVNYVILDRRNNYEVLEKQNYKNLNKYGAILERNIEKVKLKIRVEKITSFLNKQIENHEEGRKIILDIERVINERRKV